MTDPNRSDPMTLLQSVLKRLTRPSPAALLHVGLTGLPRRIPAAPRRRAPRAPLWGRAGSPLSWGALPSRHFKRPAILDLLHGTGGGKGGDGESGLGGKAVPAQVSRELRRIASDDVSAAIVRLDSHEDGLSQAEARARLERWGPNELEHDKPL